MTEMRMFICLLCTNPRFTGIFFESAVSGVSAFVAFNIHPKRILLYGIHVFCNGLWNETTRMACR